MIKAINADGRRSTEHKSTSSASGEGSVSSATGDLSASSAKGYRSAASATGHKSTSSATGHWSASSTTGNGSASSATGYKSASSATGYGAAALSTGSYSTARVTRENADTPESVAITTGYQGSAAGSLGDWLVLTERDEERRILDVQAVRVDGEQVKADTFYRLAGGNIEAVTA